MSKRNFILTHENLRTFLKYDPETGVFTWLKRRTRANVGDIAGSLSNATGYISIGICGTKHHLHRLAWFYANGQMPSGFIDHIDGNKTNNRLSNLRELSNKANCENRKGPQRDNKLGILGVVATGSRFAATIKHNGKKIWIGTFDTAASAHDAYLVKKREIHAGNTL